MFGRAIRRVSQVSNTGSHGPFSGRTSNHAGIFRVVPDSGSELTCAGELA